MAAITTCLCLHCPAPPKEQSAGTISILPNGTVAHVNHLRSGIGTTVSRNRNLSDAQKEPLHWHCKLGHAGFDNLKWVIHQGSMPVKNANCGKDTLETTLCEACQFASQCKRPPKAAVMTKQVAEKEMAIKKCNLFPGQRVSQNHCQSALPG